MAATAKGRPSAFKKFMAVVFALVSIGALALLGLLFWNVAFLPMWLTIVLLSACGILVIATIWLLVLYLAG